ncbi:MAG: hypothetical protein J5669_05015 [Bacteroidales bacterium]|nr:hypothetical protein [Bacteroidales bacterium]
MLLFFLPFLACTKAHEEQEGGLVPVSLSLSLEGDVVTKSSGPVVQSGESADFRGITEITLVPYKTRTVNSAPGDILSTHERLGYCESLGDIDAVYVNNHGLLFNQKMVPYGTDAFLFYGKAKPLYPDDPAKEGVLIASGVDGSAGDTASDIVFTPQAIGLPVALGQTATFLANLLTSVAQTSAGEVSFEQAFPEFFARFTNSGNLMAGSTEGVRLLLTDLYNSTFPPGYDGVAAAIRSAIVQDERISYDTNAQEVVFTDGIADYPGSSLPEGAAVLRWDGAKFVTGDATGAMLAPMDHYCYPIGLWYYANTTISTSDVRDYASLSSVYSGTEAASSWTGDNGVLSQYVAAHGFVGHRTLSIALEEPVRYAVGMLELTLQKTTGSDLHDFQGHVVEVNFKQFPVTGLILGGQEPQLFDFTASGSDAFYVYDTFFDNTAYLSSTQNTVPLRTLALESPREASIHFALEFRNDGTDSFVGATGRVLRGSKFYLLGELNLADAADRNVDGEYRTKVFEKHRKTVVSVRVNSLQDAYTIIPDLRQPQLKLGLSVQFNWTLSTPTNVPVF